MSGEKSEPVEVGQKWKHRRESWRHLTITGVDDEYVEVRRNTSNRQQAVKLTTLRRNYQRSTS